VEKEIKRIFHELDIPINKTQHREWPPYTP
jgi:hypothetical protein